jgi:hypothetical protein
MPRANTIPQLQPNGVAEIRKEVPLGFRISVLQTGQVIGIESREIQERSSRS